MGKALQIRLMAVTPDVDKVSARWPQLSQRICDAITDDDLPKLPACRSVLDLARALPQTLRLNGVGYMLIAFFAYSALEATSMQWASSYFTEYRGLDTHIAAMLGSLFYIGLTVGRLISGFVSEKLGDKRLIRIGVAIIAVGIVLLALPLKAYAVSIAGFLVVGFGCAPVYPCIIHSTPFNFGAENSQAVIGVEMAFAYIGTTFMPPLFGLVAQYADIALLPLFLAFFGVFLFCMTELLNRSQRGRTTAQGR